VARILCVDDDARILGIFERLLTGAGHEYVAARNVGETFHLLERSDFDLIISDLSVIKRRR
jgi:DNA-binding NtrC family response regulator